MAEKNNPTTSGSGSPTKIQVDTSSMNTAYANFCRLTTGPDELILDLGLNPHSSPQGPGAEPIHLNQRVILNFVTAKRLMQLLHMTITQHEKTYGEIELDYRKRVIGGDGQAEG